MMSLNQNVKYLGTSIVFVGKYSPAMFHPSWFKHFKLVRDAEADTATLIISHPTISQAQIGEFLITAEENRLILKSNNQSLFLALKDLSLSIVQLLEAVPVRQLGINFEAHYSAKSEQSWHQFGHSLAPKEVWSNFIENPGMHTMTIEGKNPRAKKGYTRIKVEPSRKLTHGISMDINNHFDFGDVQDSVEAINCIRDDWSNTESNSYDIINKVINHLTSFEK